MQGLEGRRSSFEEEEGLVSRRRKAWFRGGGGGRPGFEEEEGLISRNEEGLV